jgi:hypothetical protein
MRNCWYAAVFSYEADFPGPIVYTDFDTAMLIEASSLFEASALAAGWALRHNQINHSEGCELVGISAIEFDKENDERDLAGLSEVDTGTIQ